MAFLARGPELNEAGRGGEGIYPHIWGRCLRLARAKRKEKTKTRSSHKNVQNKTVFLGGSLESSIATLGERALPLIALRSVGLRLSQPLPATSGSVGASKSLLISLIDGNDKGRDLRKGKYKHLLERNVIGEIQPHSS